MHRSDTPIAAHSAQSHAVAASLPRRGLRLRSVALVVGIIAWVVLLGTWISLAFPSSMENWLSEFRLSDMEITGSCRGSKGCPSGQDELTYLGDGRAGLGRYDVTIFDPVTRTRLQTDFLLVGNTTCADEKSFRAFTKSNHHLLREQVMVTLRDCDASDLVTRDLHLLERKVASRVNRALGRRFLKSADIQNLEVYESFEKSGLVRVKLPKKKRAR